MVMDLIIYDDGHNNSNSDTSSERRQRRRKRIRKHNDTGRRSCCWSSISPLPLSSSFLLLSFMIITCCCFCITCTNAFPTYLMSGSGCYTELDVDEVIMNSNVVSYEDQLSDSTKPKMNIVVNGHVPKQIQIQQQQGDISATSTTSGGGGMLQLSYFPINLNLQVLPDMTISGNTLSQQRQQQMKEAIADYQYVIDIIHPPDDNSAEDGPPDASFEDGGMCERKHRISGRGQKDTVSLHINDASSNALVPVVKLVAGWAAGHEAVKLTPMLTIQQHPWTKLLSADCQHDSLDVTTVTGRYRFVEAALKLHVSSSEYSSGQQQKQTTNSYIVKLLGNSNIETLVLDCNQNCIFTSGGVGKVVCDGRRVVLDAVLLGGPDINIDDEASSWPVAVINNDHEGGGGGGDAAIVSGLYSIATEPEIRRTKKITLPHSKLRAGGAAAAAANNNEHQDEQQKQQHQHLNDPQKDVDERARYNNLFDQQVNKRKRQQEEKEKEAALAKGQPNFFGLLIILVLIPIIIIPVYYWVFISSNNKKKKLWRRRGNTTTRSKIT